MPLSTADVYPEPAPSNASEASATSVPPSSSSEPTETETSESLPAGPLLPASESSDATVQTLLAQREVAYDRGDSDAAAAVTAALAELGYR